MVRNLKQLDKLKFEAVTIPSMGSNDTNRTVHALSAGTAGPSMCSSETNAPCTHCQRRFAASINYNLSNLCTQPASFTEIPCGKFGVKNLNFPCADGIINLSGRTYLFRHFIIQ